MSWFLIFLKDNFVGFRIIGFKFQQFKYVIPLFLASLVSGEKLAVNLIEDLLYVMCCLSLATFKILSLSLFFNSLILMWLSVGIFELILLGSVLSFLDFWIYRFMFFIKLEKFLAFISSNILSALFFLSSPSGVPTMHMLLCLMVSHRSLRYCLFLLSFSRLSRLDNISGPIFKFADFIPACQNLLLKPYGEFQLF